MKNSRKWLFVGLMAFLLTTSTAYSFVIFLSVGGPGGGVTETPLRAAKTRTSVAPTGTFN